jgi:hypothetical protein
MRRSAVHAVVLVAAAARWAHAAEEPPIEVNPNRPTFATPALTTQEGVAELEFGLQRTFARDGGTASFTPYLLKLGLLKRLELRIGGNGVLRLAEGGVPPATGYADTTFGAQWCYLKDGPGGFDQAVQLTWKDPTGSAARGLGSGKPDTTLMVVLSRDIGAFHVDVNALETWLGQAPVTGGGTTRQTSATVAASRTLDSRWSVTFEVYTIGPSPAGARVVSNLWCAGYKVSPRLVLDGGVDVGLSHAAQKIAAFAGLTVGLARFRHPAAP